MFNQILVPLDGSRFAEAALPIALRLAASAHAKLHLVTAHQPIPVTIGAAEMVPLPEGLDEELRGRERAYLAETVKTLGKTAEELVTWVEEEGPAGPMICETATRLRADLVVMSTHGRGAIGRLWFGSTADYLVRHLSTPILLVHPDRVAETPTPWPIRGILVALDLSAYAETILEPVVALAQLTQAHITLLHAVEPAYQVTDPVLPYPVSLDPSITEFRFTEAQGYLDAVADRLRARGLSVSTRVAQGPSAAGSLLEALAGARIDLLAVTTHGAGGTRRLLLGSIADKVIRGAAKPVLVLRPAGAGS